MHAVVHRDLNNNAPAVTASSGDAAAVTNAAENVSAEPVAVNSLLSARDSELAQIMNEGEAAETNARATSLLRAFSTLRQGWETTV